MFFFIYTIFIEVLEVFAYKKNMHVLLIKCLTTGASLGEVVHVKLV